MRNLPFLFSLILAFSVTLAFPRPVKSVVSDEELTIQVDEANESGVEHLVQVGNYIFVNYNNKYRPYRVGHLAKIDKTTGAIVAYYSTCTEGGIADLVSDGTYLFILENTAAVNDTCRDLLLNVPPGYGGRWRWGFTKMDPTDGQILGKIWLKSTIPATPPRFDSLSSSTYDGNGFLWVNFTSGQDVGLCKVPTSGTDRADTCFYYSEFSYISQPTASDGEFVYAYAFQAMRWPYTAYVVGILQETGEIKKRIFLRNLNVNELIYHESIFLKEESGGTPQIWLPYHYIWRGPPHEPGTIWKITPDAAVNEPYITYTSAGQDSVSSEGSCIWVVGDVYGSYPWRVQNLTVLGTDGNILARLAIDPETSRYTSVLLREILYDPVNRKMWATGGPIYPALTPDRSYLLPNRVYRIDARKCPIQEQYLQGRFFLDDGTGSGTADNGIRDGTEAFVEPPTGTVLELKERGSLLENIPLGDPADSCGSEKGFKSRRDLTTSPDYELVTDLQRTDSSWRFTGAYYTADQSGACTNEQRCPGDPFCADQGQLSPDSRRYHITGIDPDVVANIWFGLKFIPKGTIQGRIFNDDGGGNPANAGNGIMDPGESFVTSSISALSISPTEIQEGPPQDGCDDPAQGYRFKDALYDVNHTITLNVLDPSWKVSGAYYTLDQRDLSCLVTDSGAGKVGTPISASEYRVENVQTNANSPTVNLWFGVAPNSAPICTWDPLGGIPPDPDGDGNPNLVPGETWTFKVFGEDVDRGELLAFAWQSTDSGGNNCGTFGPQNPPYALNPPSGTLYNNTRDWTMPDPSQTCNLEVRVSDALGATGSCQVTIGPRSLPWTQVINGDIYANCSPTTCEDSLYGISVYVHHTPLTAKPYFLASAPRAIQGGSLTARLGIECRNCQTGASLSERSWEIDSYNQEIEWPRRLLNKITASDRSRTLKIIYDDGSGGDFWLTPANALPGDPTIYLTEGNVRVREDVTEIRALVISKRMIIVEDTGTHNPLKVRGSLFAARGFDFEQRELTDNRDPAIQIEYDPQYLILTHPKFDEAQYSWKEKKVTF